MEHDVEASGLYSNEFKRSIWKGLLPIAAGVAMAAYGVWSENMVFSALAALALLSGTVELLRAVREPVLSITPGVIMYRAGFLARPREIARPDVESWTKEGSVIVVNRKGHKPVKINLSLLRGCDQPRVTGLLRSYCYPESE